MDQPVQQYETVTHFNRVVSGLLNGNNLHTKPTTIRNVGTIEVGTYTVQTIRVSGDVNDQGDHVAIEYTSKDGLMQIVLPPQVVSTIIRHVDGLATRTRRNNSKAAMKERMLAGYKPTPPPPGSRKCRIGKKRRKGKANASAEGNQEVRPVQAGER